MNLADLLDDHPADDGDALLCSLTGELSARAVRTIVAERAAVLVDEHGLEPGQAVALQMPDGPEVALWLLAVWRAGGVAVPLNERMPVVEREEVLADLGPALVVDASGEPRGWDGPDGIRWYEPGTAFVLWTSGTTGRPKPILHTHDAYLELIDRVLAPLRGGEPGPPSTLGKPNLIPVSLALNAGIYNLLFGLRAGAPLVLLGRFEPAGFAELVRRYGITSTVLPPAAMATLTDAPDVADLAPLRYVRSITAPLTPLQARRFTERFGVTVLNGYGQAEIGEVIGWTAADARAHPDKIGAIGRPHPGVDVRLAESGELLVRPPRMAAGYASGDDLADRIDADGFVRTGDLATIDDDGFVWIEGRIADVINRGGNKVVPEQVEEVLALDPAVREVAVVGVPDERLGEVPVAFVVGEGWTAEDLEALCRQHLVPYKVPVAFEAVASVPRTEVGKVRRADLRARWTSS